jgi:hypothetical protein
MNGKRSYAQQQCAKIQNALSHWHSTFKDCETSSMSVLILRL